MFFINTTSKSIFSNQINNISTRNIIIWFTNIASSNLNLVLSNIAKIYLQNLTNLKNKHLSKKHTFTE